MKLLELLPKLKGYGRVKRETWMGRFLIRPMDDYEPMINCDMNSLVMDRYFITYQDLISDDWEMVE